MQKILPFGTREEVVAESERLLELGKEGGYIFSPSHSVESDTPFENILAFIEVAQKQLTQYNKTMAELVNLKDCIVSGKLEDAKAIVNEAIAAGIGAQDIINNYLIKGMEEIGQRFEEGKAFVPNLLLAARAMKGCLEILKPLLKGASGTSLGTLVIGTVKGDLHDIGKNLVASMLEGCGFEVINLGVDISDQQFVEAVKKYNPQIVCLSALLTTTMNYMQNVIDTLVAEGLRDKVKVLVGGAPVNEEFAMQIGADGYSSNANGAVLLAKRVLQAC